MSLNEVSIKIPGEYIPNVFGQFDAFAKKIERTTKEGFKYLFSEGGMAFPDSLDKPSRSV